MSYRLKTRGYIVAKAYAHPKIHKPILKWTLIVYTIGSPTYSLASYSEKILKSVHANTPFYIKNSYEFKNKLKNVKIPNTHSMVFLDVVSML